MTEHLPQFRCHKTVRAAKISQVEPFDADTQCGTLHFEGGVTGTHFDQEFQDKHNPQVGQYFVRYEDGYTSVSPAEAFESGYTPLVSVVARPNLITFDLALTALKCGHAVARTGWNGKGMFVYCVPGNAYPAQTDIAKAYFGEGSLVPYGPYLALKGVDGTVNTWVPSISDIFAEDWQIVEVG